MYCSVRGLMYSSDSKDVCLVWNLYVVLTQRVCQVRIRSKYCSFRAESEDRCIVQNLEGLCIVQN